MARVESCDRADRADLSVESTEVEADAKLRVGGEAREFGVRRRGRWRVMDDRVLVDGNGKGDSGGDGGAANRWS